jgi:hypothetical protein
VSTTNATDDLMDLFCGLYLPPRISAETRAGFMSRDLVCTPYLGNYGEVAGWVICVNGSPPKGTLVLSADNPDDAPVIYFTGTQTKTLHHKQKEIVRAFFDEYLRDGSEAFTLSRRSTQS